MTSEDVKNDERYLRLLSEKFPTSSAAVSELINLRAILSLPKGTEHFVSDLHGAYSAFLHMVKNASGVVREKVDAVFGNTIFEKEKRAICALIYYPEERLELERVGKSQDELDEFYRRRIHQVIDIARIVTVKYTRSKVRKRLPKEFAYVIEELLHESLRENRVSYFNAIIDAIIESGQAEQLIIAICNLIHCLVIDTLHIVGDIYDRGPGAHEIMDVLTHYHNFDIQWGNHDMEWMGAAAGNKALIATVLRSSIRYANIETLEEGYGINLLPLANFAMQTYKDDPCTVFQIKTYEDTLEVKRSAQLMAKMHKAISIIQFKLEGQIIQRHPEYEMDDRLLLDKIDFEKQTIHIGDKDYKMLDCNLPTIDPSNPYQLTQEEEELIDLFAHNFRHSEKLQSHLRCFYQHGSLYLVRNGFLLFHAAIPLNADGSFQEFDICGKRVKGRALMDRADEIVRKAYYGQGKEKEDALDYMLYLWCGVGSPLFNKSKMATFELYFVDDKKVQEEIKGAFYELSNHREICEQILAEFGLDPKEGRIINGHMPVKAVQGESPMKAEGKRFVIDGGFSKAYHAKTGISGYTLIYNSLGIKLVQHESFESKEQAVQSGSDIHSRIQLQDFTDCRMLIKDTDRGKELLKQVENLKALLYAYRNGIIKEKEQ
ncbi:MAG: fructose-1,6-bisphosphatase [Paludibacteraceae bacterium]|nr:fructose-1,6-bisphosphatase [Paludibacteraceae bacterium]